jgi:hypothetical protein
LRVGRGSNDPTPKKLLLNLQRIKFFPCRRPRHTQDCSASKEEEEEEEEAEEEEEEEAIH